MIESGGCRRPACGQENEGRDAQRDELAPPPERPVLLTRTPGRLELAPALEFVVERRERRATRDRDEHAAQHGVAERRVHREHRTVQIRPTTLPWTAPSVPVRPS